MKRIKQLKSLESDLEQFVEILKRYSEFRQPYEFLKVWLSNCSVILKSGFTQEELNEVSGEIYHYLNSKEYDYYPVTRNPSGEYERIREATEYEKLLGRIIEKSISLRVVDNY